MILSAAVLRQWLRAAQAAKSHVLTELGGQCSAIVRIRSIELWDDTVSEDLRLE